MLNPDFHDAANEFPMFDVGRFSELVSDICEHGQRETIKLYRGKVLDGRNRYKACIELGIEPRTEALPDDIDPWAYVWSLNGQRRDISNEVRTLIGLSCLEKSAALAAELQRIQDEANAKRSEVARARSREEDGTFHPVVRQVDAPLAPKPVPVRSSEVKAKFLKTNSSAVERMTRLEEKRPDLAKQVKTGELPAARAMQEMKRDEVVANLDDIKVREAKEAEGVYDVLVIDPPWPMEKIERDVRVNQVEFDYPTMTEKEIGAVAVPAADDCHVWLWTTHRFLPMAFRLLERWGLTYGCTFVWHKAGGFQPVGQPQYNCEFALYARKGSPQFVDTKDFKVCFEAPRTGHSKKPDEFYDLVRRVTAGRRLDMFNRRFIEGFDVWGFESVEDSVVNE